MYFVLDGTVLVHAVRCMLTFGDGTVLGASPPAQRPQTTVTHRALGVESSASSFRNRYGRDRVAGEHIATKGDIFGEGGLFSSELGDWRQENATALSWVSAYALSPAALREIAAEYPEVPSATCCPSVVQVALVLFISIPRACRVALLA